MISSLPGVKRRSNPVAEPRPGLLRYARNDGCVLVFEQKLEHRVGIDLRLLDIGNMCGIEHGDLRARDMLTDKLVGFERRRIVFARDHQRRGADFRKQWPMVHVTDALAAANIAFGLGRQEHSAHARDRLRIAVTEFFGEPALHIGIDDCRQAFVAHGLEPALPQRFVGEIR